MTPTERANSLSLVELLRKREVPGSERRETERQAELEARYCDTETEYSSNKTDRDDDSEQEL